VKIATSLFVVLPVAPLAAQGLVIPVPDSASVSLMVDSFTTSTGERRQFDMRRPATRSSLAPVVVFVNVIGPSLRTWPGYVAWARLVTERGLASVLYEGTPYNSALTAPQNIAAQQATLDSLIAAVTARGRNVGIDGTNVVLWAASANTSLGTPAALGRDHPSIKGYVLYYGAGSVADPRLDVPVFIGRAGLDNPGLNRDLDSLSRKLTRAGVALTVVNHPAGRHGFDLQDSTAVTADVIRQTLDFMASVTTAAMHQAIVAGVPETRASAAFATGNWVEAVRLYQDVVRASPTRGGSHWRLGLAQLENREHVAALASFNRARELGVGGARDIGLPAARAALRANNTDAAAEWVVWALRAFPGIRAEITADRELAPLLEHQMVRASSG
jgi:dienelactone hydrolase